MDARDIIKVGMSAERTQVVPPERTVGHFLPGMPMVYATPMMILEMEMASDDAIRGKLQPGWVTVGTEVNVRHLAAAQALGGLLAEHPTDGIADVALAAAVGADNGGDPFPIEAEFGAIAEALESL